MYIYFNDNLYLYCIVDSTKINVDINQILKLHGLKNEHKYIALHRKIKLKTLYCNFVFVIKSNALYSLLTYLFNQKPETLFHIISRILQ